jgi:predicted Zn-dependent protease
MRKTDKKKSKNSNNIEFLPLVLIFCIFHIPVVNAACNSEINNAKQVSWHMAMEWPLRPFLDNKTEYIQKLSSYLINISKQKLRSNKFDWPSESWRFLIVRDLSVNAYSIGNGKVYITDGTFTFVKTEAELAAILAHEIAHQLIGHFCHHNVAQQTQFVGSLVQVLDNDKEIEADALAIKILQKTHFSVQAILEVVKRLSSLKKADETRSIRIRELEKQIRKIKNQLPFSSSPEFIQIKKNLDTESFIE